MKVNERKPIQLYIKTQESMNAVDTADQSQKEARAQQEETAEIMKERQIMIMKQRLMKWYIQKWVNR